MGLDAGLYMVQFNDLFRTINQLLFDVNLFVPCADWHMVQKLVPLNLVNFLVMETKMDPLQKLVPLNLVNLFLVPLNLVNFFLYSVTLE